MPQNQKRYSCESIQLPNIQKIRPSLVPVQASQCLSFESIYVRSVGNCYNFGFVSHFKLECEVKEIIVRISSQDIYRQQGLLSSPGCALWLVHNRKHLCQMIKKKHSLCCQQ